MLFTYRENICTYGMMRAWRGLARQVQNPWPSSAAARPPWPSALPTLDQEKGNSTIRCLCLFDALFRPRLTEPKFSAPQPRQDAARQTIGKPSHRRQLGSMDCLRQDESWSKRTNISTRYRHSDLVNCTNNLLIAAHGMWASDFHYWLWQTLGLMSEPHDVD